MRIDWYTKGVLTVIAVLLGVMALRPYVSPDAVAHAQGSFAGVQYTHEGGNEYFFDTRNGEVWMYRDRFNKPDHYRLEKLGGPFVTVK